MNILHPLRIEAVIPRRTQGQPAHHEYFQYAVSREDGTLPSTSLLENEYDYPTLEGRFRAIGSYVLASTHYQPRTLAVDYVVSHIEHTRTYLAKSLPPITSLVDNYEWRDFYDLAPELQLPILSFPSQRV